MLLSNYIQYFIFRNSNDTNLDDVSRIQVHEKLEVRNDCKNCYRSLVLPCNKCQGDTMTSVQMVFISLSEWICKIIIFWCHCTLINKQNFLCHVFVLIGFICTIYSNTISIYDFLFPFGVLLYVIHASVYGVQFLVKLRNYYVISISIDG